MKIIILGAGVVGVTTAYQLAKDGHEVTVIDKADEAASFASLGNAGLVTCGHAHSWASPRAPGLMLQSLWRNDQKIRFQLQASPSQWLWALQFLRQCAPERSRANSLNMQRLANYSTQLLQEVVRDTGAQFDRHQKGLMYFYRTQKSLDYAVPKVELLAEGGIASEILDPIGVVAREPNFADEKDKITGALYVPRDESGDANLFTLALAETCKKLGVIFRFGESVLSLEREGDEITSVLTLKGQEKADAYVVCLGVYSPHLVHQLGLKLPIYPVRGYSATLPLTDRAKGPRHAGVDEDNLLAYTPMGNRLRLTSTAEIAGYSTAYSDRNFSTIFNGGRALFGEAADFNDPELWVGLRPMMPTGVPVIDRSPYSNLWLNTGHGHLGWTMSNGSARILADLIGQRQPQIDMEGMRYDG